MRRLFLAVGLAVVLGAIGFWLRPVFFLNQWTYAQECFAGLESRSVMVAGHRVHYLAEGPMAGPVVVLVHGLGGRAEDWTNLAPWLAKAGYRVYMPDLPGYGRSETPADFSYSVPDEAGVVVAFFDALGLKQVDLGGWSMGGWIVQRIAIEHPDRVRRLMLFDSAGIYAKPTWDTALFTSTTPEQLHQFYALLMPIPPQVPGFVVRDILRITKKRSWITQRALGSMLAGRDVTDSLLPQLKMPVLIVWGELDRITPLSQGEKIHELIPQSQLEVIPGCGHLAPSQCATRIGPKVVEFVKQ
ncbi:MAG: alpha/beta fold hydrolase [Terracidiphilus sp.]